MADDIASETLSLDQAVATAEQAGSTGPATDKPGSLGVPPSQMSLEELTRTLKKWWQKDGPHAKKWRDGDSFNLGAKSAFDFVNMRQWDEKEVDLLLSQRRVPITFNRTLPTIQAICGIEINSRHKIVYLPRTGGILDQKGQVMVKANEELSAASESFADECDAEDEQSEAFRDNIICGMGWSETRIDHDEDPTGKYVEQNLNPLEMAWDYRARKKNLADAQRIWHLKSMSLSEANSLFPGKSPEELNCAWAVADVEAGKSKIDDAGQSIDVPIENRDFDPQMEVNILRVQWWEHEPIWIVAHPAAPDQPVVMTDQQHSKFRKVFDQTKAEQEQNGSVFPPDYQVQSKRGRRKVYREAWIGNEVLEPPKPPQYGLAKGAPEAGFTMHCTTGIPDKITGYFYGMVAVMKDPQKWANAWLSQTQHILNTTAKGGILAEEDAFVDPRKAEQDYGRPDSIVFLNPGAISGNKVMQKPGVGITAGHANLLQTAINSIRDVTGVNLEIMGLRDANQPGILEAQRKQAAMTILAPWFDSLRRYRKQIGRVRLYYIQNFLATPGRMIHIKGDQGIRLVPLLRDRIIGPHDVVVSDAPTSPNQKQEAWAYAQPLLPLFADKLKGSPQALGILIRYSPLPSEMADAFIQLLEQPPPPEAQAEMKTKMAMAQSAVELNQAKAQDARAAAMDRNADAVFKLAQASAATALNAKAQQLAQAIQIYFQTQRALGGSHAMLEDDAPDALSAQPGGPGPLSLPPPPPQLPMQGGPAQGQPQQQPPFVDGGVTA